MGGDTGGSRVDISLFVFPSKRTSSSNVLFFSFFLLLLFSDNQEILFPRSIRDIFQRMIIIIIITIQSVLERLARLTRIYS